MKTAVLAVLFLAFAATAGAQVSGALCDAVMLVSPSGIINTAQGDAIIQAENNLKAKGADPRVILDDTTSITPEQYVAISQKQCPSWQSADGGVKNNLIIFIAFPKRHKMGLFMGKEFEKAIDASAIRTKFMAPGFRDGDFARGMIAGINQVGVQIEAYQTAALHPATTVVTKQAADLSGLWTFMDWFLLAAIIIIVLLGGWGLYVYFNKRRRERIAAQQNAVHWRNEAAAKVTVNPSYGYLSQEFARLNNSETYNPDTDGLEAAQYNEMAERYKQIYDKADKHETKRTKPTKIGIVASPDQANEAKGVPAYETKNPEPAPTIVTHNTTIINDTRYPTYNDPAYIPVPVVIEEPIVEREPVHERSRWSDSSSSSDTGSSSFSDSSSSSDFGSGGGFSDSSSSSDFSSGGSSDFGGGSSDF